jgi:hypothetical protein
MNKRIALELAFFSFLLIGLSVVTYNLAPEHTRPTLIAGVAGGALCLVWSARTFWGSYGKALPILTLIPVCYTLLGQVVMTWPHEGSTVPKQTSVSIAGISMFLLSIAMLTRIAYAGVFSAEHPTPTQVRANHGTAKTAFRYRS